MWEHLSSGVPGLGSGAQKDETERGSRRRMDGARPLRIAGCGMPARPTDHNS